MRRVTAKQDESGHWYVFPIELEKRWYELWELMDSDGQSTFEKAENDLIAEFSKYMTGGDLNNVQLYAEIEP